MNNITPSKCPECNSDNIEWFLSTTAPHFIVEGRLMSNDISIGAYLGCNHCSATLKTLNEDELLKRLNNGLI